MAASKNLNDKQNVLADVHNHIRIEYEVFDQQADHLIVLQPTDLKETWILLRLERNRKKEKDELLCKASAVPDRGKHKENMQQYASREVSPFHSLSKPPLRLVHAS